MPTFTSDGKRDQGVGDLASSQDQPIFPTAFELGTGRRRGEAGAESGAAVEKAPAAPGKGRPRGARDSGLGEVVTQEEEAYVLGEGPVEPPPPPRAWRSGGAVWPYVALALSVTLSVGLGGWAYVSFVRPLQHRVAAIEDELSGAKAKLSAAQEQLAASQAKNDELSRAAEALREAESKLASQVAEKEAVLSAMQSAQQELAGKLQQEIARGDVLLSHAQGELVVDLIDQVLFDSGEAELNAEGRSVLKQVGETLAKAADHNILVGGHTDAMSIAPKLLGRYRSNWELSSARALHVVHFLESCCALTGDRLAAVAYSQYRPLAANDTLAGRKKNRRIELVLQPRPRAKSDTGK